MILVEREKNWLTSLENIFLHVQFKCSQSVIHSERIVRG